MISQTEAETRVARGAAHLDTVRPNWFNAIDTGTLEIGSCEHCIAGQLASGGALHFPFTRGLTELGVPDESIAQFGMGLQTGDCSLWPDIEATIRESDRTFRALQDAWIAAIAARRFPVSPDLTIQCSWCQTIEHVGDPAQPISHSMCSRCCAKWHAEMDALELEAAK